MTDVIARDERLRLSAVRPHPNAKRPPPGPPLLPVLEPGSTPACLVARRTSLMRLLRRPRLPMRPIRISNSLWSRLTGVSGVSVWLVPKRALKNRTFCPRVALPTDRRPAESQAVSTAWRRAGACLLSCHSAVGIPQPPIPRIHRRHGEVSSFKISAQIAALNAAQTRYRHAAQWLPEGPFERRFSARQRQSDRFRDARSANCRRASP